MPSPPASRSNLVRTHILLPRELIEALDARVGPRKRSAFAVEARLRRERLAWVLEESLRSDVGPSNPAWETSESTERWVRALREETYPDANPMSEAED